MRLAIPSDAESRHSQLLQRISARKATLDERRPLPPILVAKLKEHLDVAWTYHSNAIEGSSITLPETRAILLDGLTVNGKPLREHLEVINHKHAIDFVDALATGDAPITEHALRQIHALVLRTIDDQNAGRYRRVQVYITGSEYVPPEPVAVPPLMADLGQRLASEEFAALHPVEQAARAHLRLVDIHPFIDGNGRTARLLMNLLLMRHGYPPAIIRYEGRPAYYAALEKAHRQELEPFLTLVAEAVARSLDMYLAATAPTEN
jgi:Fic family protein